MPAGFNLFSIVILIGIFYFFLIMPEQKKQKKFKAMINSLKEGNVVYTRGGIIGRIVAINDNIVTLETGPDNVKINVSKQGIGSVTESVPENEKAEVTPEQVEAPSTSETQEIEKNE